MLTKEGIPYVWSSDCQKACDELKDHLIKAPVLVFPNFVECFILETVASGLGLGGVLSQKQLDGKVAPIAYTSNIAATREKLWYIEVRSISCCLGCQTF